MDYVVYGEKMSQVELKKRYGVTAKEIAECAARTCNSAYWIGYELEQLINYRNGKGEGK